MKKRGKLFKVLMLVPYCIWNGVKAIDEIEAINKVNLPREFDMNEYYKLVAEEEIADGD